MTSQATLLPSDEVELDADRVERIRVGVVVGDHRQGARARAERVGIAERIEGEIAEADRAVPQAKRRRHRARQQPGIGDGHARSCGGRRPGDA